MRITQKQYWTALTAGVVVVLGCLNSELGNAQSNQTGKAQYVAYGCSQCHGFEGQGGIAGPRIAPGPYPFVAFAQLIRRPANVMPAYAASVLEDDTLRLIFEYVRSIPEPEAVDDIPLLR